MVKVSNIVITEHLFKNQLDKPDDDTKKCLNLIKSDELLKLLPKNPKYTIRFKLENANSQLANALRRCLEIDIPTHALTFNLMHTTDGRPADFIADLRTNDKNIFGKCDELKKRIEGIPIKQNIDPNEYKISLNIQNKTNDLIDITPRSFKILHKNKQIDVHTLMYPDYILARLYPNCYLNIDNIYIKTGIGLTDSNSFKFLSNVYYEILDEPLMKINKKYVGKSSLESNYTTFLIGYSTYRNDVAIKEPIKIVCNILINKLNVILNEWEKINNTASNASDKINIAKKLDIYIITILGETYTISRLLYYYIYLEMPTIEFASGGIEHLDKHKATIYIKSNDYFKIFKNAIINSIKDINSILSYF